ncbi:hypothetical protein GGR53DRAFT_532670 [Hypoxylon sp. FL1150]|nr:hypothetical protein GGR53DRAFT_532670 [Hypoxylon sp. FL1150]
MATRPRPFYRLPYKLRRAIWDLALDNIPPRTFAFSFYDTCHPYKKLIVPPVVQACHESRDAAVSYYRTRVFQDCRSAKKLSATGWFNPEKDILYFKMLILESDVEDMLARLKSEYKNFGLDRVRSIALDKMGGDGEPTKEKLLIRQCFDVLPSVQTLYWLIPDKYITSPRGKPGETLKPLTMTPSPYMRPGEVFPPVQMVRPLYADWWMTTERLRTCIESMIVRKEIPREPEVIEAMFAMPVQRQNAVGRAFDPGRQHIGANSDAPPSDRGGRSIGKEDLFKDSFRLYSDRGNLV